jgi:hypothetical protein
MSPSPFSFGTKILGGGAVLLTSFLLVGYLLPGTWEAEASLLVPSDTEALLPFLDSPEGWQKWTPWPEVGVERSGPERGAGARLAWDDPELGAGSFTLGTSNAGRIEYSVEVGEGAMHATGEVTLAAEGGGVRVLWHEEGDLGWNPLMGYWALSMGRAQGEELAKGLERLAALVAEAAIAELQGSAPDGGA